MREEDKKDGHEISTASPTGVRTVIEAEDIKLARWELMDPRDVQRDAAWERRKSFLTVIAGCKYRPLKANSFETPIQSEQTPPVPVVQDKATNIENSQQHNLGIIFGNEGTLRSVASFL